MRLLQNYWLQITLTVLAMAYAYRLDARDGNIAWPLLLTGTVIAACGFFGGNSLIKKYSAKHDHS